LDYLAVCRHFPESFQFPEQENRHFWETEDSQRIFKEDLPSTIRLTTQACAYRVMYRKDPGLRLDVLLKTKTPRFEQFTAFRAEADHVTFFNLCEEVYHGIQKEGLLPQPDLEMPRLRIPAGVRVLEGEG
jgi:hypothetical protein